MSTSTLYRARTITSVASRSLAISGVLATIAATAVTTSIAAVASGVGVSFADRTGAAIPVSGFSMMTVLFSLLGVALAVVLQRRAARPRVTFVRVTLSLLVLSFVPDLVSGFTADATVLLILAHLAAAAIVIPTLAARLSARR